jgi:cellulose synthase (UDP-forming)
MSKAIVVTFWALAAIAVIGVITLPISLQAHLIAGTIALSVIIVLKLLRAQGIWRLIALALGTAIVLRYIYWRTTSTLPPVDQLENFIPGLLLYLAELYSVGMLGLSLFVVAMPLPRRDAPPIPEGRYPTVDVFVPSYNEDAQLIATTLAAAKAMEYPADRLTVWLLDDGGTDEKCSSKVFTAAAAAQTRRAELQALCERLGVRYLTRSRNVHAKAGNLNNGLEHSEGDLIVVFDADHAPARSFLIETVGYFDLDPKLFLVQTPHFFINPDPLERNLRTFQTMPSENEMFYGVIQRGLDKWNAAFFCGSAAVLSRKALKVTGGFSGLSITEDCETALELHSRGWNSIYVDKPLIAGLQPETFASFIGQRSRWAQGMMQILRFRFPVFKRGLSIPQRLCYMSSTLFWLFPFNRWIFLISPFFYLFFSLEIFVASGAEFMAYTFSYMAVNLMMQNYLYGRYRWPWISELYEYIQSVYLLPAVISVMLNPRKPTFKVTAKNESLDVSRISELGRPFFVIFAILVAAVGVTVWKIVTQPYQADVTLVVGLWNVLNLIIAGCALGVVAERQNLRPHKRIDVERWCKVLVRGQSVPAVIETVSISAAGIRPMAASLALAPGETAELTIVTTGDEVTLSLPVTVLSVDRDDKGLALGCEFDMGAPAYSQALADLFYADADQWSRFQQSRHRNIGVLVGTVRFLAIAMFQTGRGLSYLFGLQRLGRGAAEPKPVVAVESAA